ncbi:1,2-phenylacetyl-CoA epoxidase subunit PaaD [Aquipuribacter nitratireducens]|uniref:1,2-phenylacetyl-CoA epoxidase subunit PaaD n=1 Tax=Aquipuribacter nitratireducens TaxID=650104 RepID=A0ABW0GT14_9MICO
MLARDDAVRVLEQVTDPEIPVLTIADLGVLRDVVVADDGAVRVDITPTYSGCPAMDEITADVRGALLAAGAPAVDVRIVLDPAWTTDWLSADGRRKLAEYGIAPPGPRAAGGPVPLELGYRPGLGPGVAPACPRCGGTDTEELARFASTACKSLWRCLTCREPFDHFKEF